MKICDFIILHNKGALFWALICLAQDPNFLLLLPKIDWFIIAHPRKLVAEMNIKRY